MNILIKGLEIPENGYLDVRILNRSGLEMAAVTWNDSGCYPYAEAHNVVVLPERHGRLIDADALKDALDYYIREAGWSEEINKALRWVKDEFIDSEQAIVEAEGEEQ